MRFFQGGGVYLLVWSGRYWGFIMRGRGCLGLYALECYLTTFEESAVIIVYLSRENV